MKRKVRGVLLVVLGLALTFTGAVTYARYEHEANLAGERAQMLLQELSLDMQQRQQTGVTLEAAEDQLLQVTVEGQALIGILQIEEAGITLPVMERWDYEKLKIAPCRYRGSVEEDNLVLLGHNYEHHFGRLDQLETGDAVEFMDVAGKRHCFSVAKTAVLQPTQVEDVITAPYPLTIFTCTPGGQSRFVVYCERSVSA